MEDVCVCQLSPSSIYINQYKKGVVYYNFIQSCIYNLYLHIYQYINTPIGYFFFIFLHICTTNFTLGVVFCTKLFTVNHIHKFHLSYILHWFSYFTYYTYGWYQVHKTYTVNFPMSGHTGGTLLSTLIWTCGRCNCVSSVDPVLSLHVPHK